MNPFEIDDTFEKTVYDLETRVMINSTLLELLFAKYVADSKNPFIEWRNLSGEIFRFGEMFSMDRDQGREITRTFVRNIRRHLKKTYPTNIDPNKQNPDEQPGQPELTSAEAEKLENLNNEEKEDIKKAG